MHSPLDMQDILAEQLAILICKGLLVLEESWKKVFPKEDFDRNYMVARMMRAWMMRARMMRAWMTRAS